MGASEKDLYKDNGWFVGVSPRRNPEIVVACLFEGGEHGALAAAVATKVIKAYVEKQRNRRTQVAKAAAPPAAPNQAEVAAVWHDGDAKPGDNKLQGGHFTVPLDAKAKTGSAAPSVSQSDVPLPTSALQATESHTEMAKPEPETPPQAQPTQPPLKQESPDDKPSVQPNTKKPVVKPAIAPAAAAVRGSQP
jgi:hypothetical protein